MDRWARILLTPHQEAAPRLAVVTAAGQASSVGFATRGLRVPICFAYGANMDIPGMSHRCPASKPLGAARLANHRIYIMAEGYASVRPEPGATVHGLLWDLALADVAALDAFEEVGRGLYAKIVRPVIRPVGTRQALIYVGRSSERGRPRPGYLETIMAAAEALDLPRAYRGELATMLRGGTRGPAHANGVSPDGSGPVPGVRARFATPFDRR